MDENSRNKFQAILSGFNLILAILFGFLLSYESTRIEAKNNALSQHEIAKVTSSCSLIATEASNGDPTKAEGLKSCKDNLNRLLSLPQDDYLENTNFKLVLSQSMEKVEYALIFLEELKKSSPEKGRNLVFLSSVIKKDQPILRAESKAVRKFGLFLIGSLIIFAIFFRDKSNRGFYSNLLNSVKFKGDS